MAFGLKSFDNNNRRRFFQDQMQFRIDQVYAHKLHNTDHKLVENQQYSAPANEEIPEKLMNYLQRLLLGFFQEFHLVFFIGAFNIISHDFRK